MEKQELKSAFENITPSDATLNKVLRKTLNAPVPVKRGRSPLWAAAPVAAAAVALTLCYSAAFGHYAAKPASEGEGEEEAITEETETAAQETTSVADGIKQIEEDLQAIFSAIEETQIIPSQCDPVFAPPIKDAPIQDFTEFGEGGFVTYFFGYDLGEEILAAAYGTVVYAGEATDLGNTVVIRHDDLWDGAPTYYTLYGYCDELYVNVGDTVTSGQLIANLGYNKVQEGKEICLFYAIRQDLPDNPIDVNEWVNGAWAPPLLAMPIKGAYISAEFGDIFRVFDGQEGHIRHSGIDFTADKGTDIYAAESGTVTFSGNIGDGYGNYVIIDHGNIQTLYAHCEELLVSEGDHVAKGQVIATVGSTGQSTGDHLHFEVIRGEDQRVNPELYLPPIN